MTLLQNTMLRETLGMTKGSSPGKVNAIVTVDGVGTLQGQQPIVSCLDHYVIPHVLR